MGPCCPGASFERDRAGEDAYRRTIRGYFRHQLVVDPYARVGHQDLTADVDFRAVDLHGSATGFETVLFTTVADLLRADGGQDRLSELRGRALSPSTDALQAGREAQVLENLLDPGRLGGAFKAMLQVRE
jgi:SAM-dependent MidA family methyltransferase